MTQPDVSLTDYALALECLCLTGLVSRMPQASFRLRRPFLAFFFSVAIAAAAGGTVHGFFLDETSLGYRILWPFTLIAMGVTAVSAVHIASGLLCSQSTGVLVKRAALAAFVIYSSIVLFVRSDFLTAILGYLPALIFLGAAFLAAYRKGMGQGFLLGFAGLCTMLLAAATQQAKLGINAQYFGYNALYHLLQALAFLLVFCAARASSKPRDTIE